MALTIGNLYQGQLGTTVKTLLYTVTTGKAAIVKNIRVVNTDSSARTVNFYYLRNLGGAVAKQITPVSLSIPVGGLAVFDDELTMFAGDQILGDGSIAGKLDCVISGIERDA